LNDHELTPDQKADAQAIFEGRIEGRTACHHCAGIHYHVAKLPMDRQPCPRIKRIEHHPDGSRIAVEYWQNGSWESDVVFPAEAYEEDPDT